MPPRKGKKKLGKRTVALAKAALDDSNIPSCEDLEMSDKIQPREAEEKLSQMISEMKEKVEMRCTLMMQQVPFMQESLARGLSKASSGVPKRYLNMNLVKYCEEYGEDYDEILLAARTPQEREAFLAEFVDDDDEQDENDPGTTLKGQRPPAARQIAATPSGRTRASGRTLRTAVKAVPPAETPSTRSKRGGAATAARAPPSTRARRAGPRAPSILMTMENGLLVTETGPAPQLFTKDGAKFYSPTGKGGIAATPGPRARRAAPSAGTDALKESLYGGVDTGTTKAVLMKPKVREALRQDANPDLTMFQHLEAIVNRKIEEAPVRMEERCDRLRAEWKRGTDEMTAKLRAALPKKEKDGATTGMDNDEDRREGGTSMDGEEAAVEEQVPARGGPAKLQLAAAGGPYDGVVFELNLEEDGDARMIGRSSGRKFKLKGVSLPKDTEVSTTHGKFENSAGKVNFTDLGSTNGTEVDGEEADEEKPYELSEGSKLLIGQSVFTVSITWER